MRAHQTYRLLLNTPVFKEMKVGDSKGNEPAGKSFMFLVLENGKSTPHMVKVSLGRLSLFLVLINRPLVRRCYGKSKAIRRGSKVAAGARVSFPLRTARFNKPRLNSGTLNGKG